ncbi:hypothetical protein L873DRAFT_1830739 [Choiromyces venosus 120613-1]|uniref:Uncharacterized protein n=1 Tax=Choiromyces venosus 120613-1 TaxID=1336337 RepID=A0A3N4J5H4_9PEZI|nr:hypothetical protein L873DRAFT_1830739 [Choiromyces venosus 120613-1]
MDTSITLRASSKKLLPMPSASSRPMIIPTKGSGLTREKQGTQRHAGIPPAVAALLAVTTIPPPGSRKQRILREQKSSLNIFVEPPTPSHPPPSFDDALEEDENLVLESVELSRDPSRDSIRSALSVLLGPPDEEHYESSPLEKSPSDSQLSLRSSSSSSESVPSLGDDDESTSSWNSVYSSPLARGRSAGDPRFRGFSSTPEDSQYDHPLMWDSDDDVSNVPTLEPEVGFFSEDALKRITRRLNFKSNLTASIRVLKSAARSFSSISVSTPLIQPDDYLTRSILSITPQFTDEKRPAPTLDTPTPALRRYLNPTNPVPDLPCTGAIQMQTYHSNRPDLTENKHSPSSPSTSDSNGSPVTRPREVRENGDFLRVIVLEMNMRRGGKLADTAAGKARLVLPPRQPCRFRAVGDPGRWEAWVCVYDE